MPLRKKVSNKWIDLGELSTEEIENLMDGCKAELEERKNEKHDLIIDVINALDKLEEYTSRESYSQIITIADTNGNSVDCPVYEIIRGFEDLA